MQIIQFMFGIANLVIRSEIVVEFIFEGFPVIQPYRRLIGKSGNSGFKPFLSNILKVGQCKGNPLRIMIKVGRALEVELTLEEESFELLRIPTGKRFRF